MDMYGYRHSRDTQKEEERDGKWIVGKRSDDLWPWG